MFDFFKSLGKSFGKNAVDNMKKSGEFENIVRKEIRKVMLIEFEKYYVSETDLLKKRNLLNICNKIKSDIEAM